MCVRDLIGPSKHRPTGNWTHNLTFLIIWFKLIPWSAEPSIELISIEPSIRIDKFWFINSKIILLNVNVVKKTLMIIIMKEEYYSSMVKGLLAEIYFIIIYKRDLFIKQKTTKNHFAWVIKLWCYFLLLHTMNNVIK